MNAVETMMHDLIDAETKGLLQRQELGRRAFAVASLATGFTLAAGPINAQSVITTDSNGLTAGEVRIPAAGGEIPGYRAKPASGAGFPVVLVVQEIFGVHEHIRDICRRFAKLGYLAVAPELYARQGDPSRISDMQQIVREIVARVPDAQVMGDLDAAARWAGADGGNVQRLSITGFCWGGRIVWLYAAHNPALKAGVAWYGRVVGQASEMNPRHPIDVAAQLHAPVLGLYGGADAGIPNDTVEQMRAALRAANKPSEIVLYPDTPHGFHADFRASYRAEQARDGWTRLQAWFRQHGAGPVA
jgi:carboxymethylenebutenolidase